MKGALKRGVDVVGTIEDIAEESMTRTGFFHSGRTRTNNGWAFYLMLIFWGCLADLKLPSLRQIDAVSGNDAAAERLDQDELCEW
jgi:hypothetical protein